MAENDEDLLARKPVPAKPIEVPFLREPNIRMDFQPTDGGKGLNVSLNAPRTSGSETGLPFIALMQDQEVNFALSAEMKSRLQDKLRAVAPYATIDVIEVGVGRPASSGGGNKSTDPASADKGADSDKAQDKNIGALAKGAAAFLGGFEVNFNTKINFNHNPKFEEVKKDLQAEFDSLRRDAYTERAKEWALNGGAVVPGIKDANGKPLSPTVHVSDIDAINYLRTPQKQITDGSGDIIRPGSAPVPAFSNDPDAMAALKSVIRRHDAAGDKSQEYQDLLKGFNSDFIKNIRAQNRADAGGEPGVNLAQADTPTAMQKSAGPLLDQPGHPLGRQFQQALQGAGGDKDAAALAVDTISRAPGFKPEQDISVIQGKNGLIVSQGDGATGINLQVPQSKPGDFERMSAQSMPPNPPPAQVIAQAPDQEQQRLPSLARA